MAIYDGRQDGQFRFNPYESAVARDGTSSSFLNGVYRHMALGLGLTGLVAMAAANSPAALGVVLEHPFILMAAQLGVVFALTGLQNRLSLAAAMAMFYAYSALTGLMLSVIFLVYTQQSIAATFFVTGGTFAVMSIYGYTTKRDLTGMGNFLMMGLIGLVIATVVNMFFASSLLTAVTTYIGVLIFVGLTAFDTQRIRNMAASDFGASNPGKLAIQGALMLYLDFINLFIYLLRILGNRRSN